MPQFDPTWYASQIFWVLLTFSALFFVMTRFIVPKLSGTIDERDKKIDNDLKTADQLKTEAEHALAEYQKAIAAANERSKETLAQTYDQIIQTMKEKEKAFTDKMNEKIAESEKVLQAEKKQAVSSLKNVSRVLTQDIIKKLVDMNIDSKDIKQKISSLSEKNL